jgi:hypothetical protein
VKPTIPNPYAPPSASQGGNKSTPANLLVVLIGASIGNGISYAVLSVSGLAFVWVLAAGGVPAQEIYSRAYQSTGYLIFAHLLGLICLVPGGYWTARFSTERQLGNAVFAGILLSLFSLLQTFVPYNTPIPLWSQLASVLIPVPAYLLGAYIWRRTHY